MTQRLSKYPKHLLLVLSLAVFCLTGAASPTQARSLHPKVHGGGNYGHQHLKRQVRVDKLPKASRHTPTIKPHYTIPIVPKGPQIPPRQTVALPHGYAQQPKTSAKTHAPNTLSGNTNGDEELEQFQAATFGGNTPPDNGFGVGPNDIMQFVNVTGIDFDRTTAHTQRKTWNLSDFFGAPVHPTEIVNVGYSDPRVIYDAGSGRWFASVLIFDTCSKCATSSNSEVDVAVSQSADPTGVWNIYPVETTNTNVLLDQPKLGVSNDKAVLTYNENGFDGPYRFVEVQKSDLVALAGSVNVYLFSTDSSHYNVIPVLSLGSTNTEYAVSANRGGSTLTLFAFTGTPTSSPAYTTQDFSIGTVNDPPGAVQKGDSRTLDSGTAGVQSAVWQNNILWAAGADSCTPPGDSTSRACLRFDEINTSGSPSLTQDVDAGEVGGYITYPSVVMDQSANLYSGFSTSSSSQYPTASEAYFAGGSFIFPPGYNPAIDYQTGVGPYDCTFCTAANGDARDRWGDYSGAAQDPNNPHDVWLSAEFGTFDTTTDDWAVEPARFTAAAPVVGGLSPMSGYDELSSCHTTVTINGTDFQTGATVKFGGTNSASVNVLSPESLTASAPPKPAGTVDVTVQTPNGISATSAVDHFTYVADTTPPTTTASYSGANGAGWNKSIFTVSFAASDNTCGSGVKQITISATGAQSMSATDYSGNSASVLVTTEGVTTFTYFATDNAGNVETGNTLTVRLDKTAPGITITTPSATSYFLHQPVAANYGCSDALSGLATCVGTVANGNNIDTATLGNKAFTVNATDIADNAGSKTVNYAVTYKICLLYDPTQPVHNNQIPIKLEICDNSNANLSSSSIVLKAVNVSPAGSVVSSSNPGNLFRFDPTVAAGGGYLYNLNVKGLPAGSYTLNFTVAGDPITHHAPFQLK